LSNARLLDGEVKIFQPVFDMRHQKFRRACATDDYCVPTIFYRIQQISSI